MAFSMKALPSSLCVSHRALGVETHSRTSYRLPHGAYQARLRPSIRCSTQDEGETSGHEEMKRKEPAVSKSELLHAEESSDPYAGWEPLPPEPKGNWKAALLQVGAGFVLAIGFGLVGFTTYQKLERRLRPPVPVATQQQITSTSESEPLDARKDEPSVKEDQAETPAENLNEEDSLQDEANKRDEPEAKIGNSSPSLKEEEETSKKKKKKTSKGQVSFPSEETGDLDVDDEEAVFFASFDDDEDHEAIDHQQGTSVNKSAKEDSEQASNSLPKETPNLLSSVASTRSDEGLTGAYSKVATDGGELGLRGAEGKPDLSTESHYTKDLPSESSGISRIVVPELAEGNRILEIVLMSPEATNHNRGQKASGDLDTEESQEDKEQSKNEFHFSTEGVNVSKSAQAPAVKDADVHKHAAAAVVPEMEKILSKERHMDAPEKSQQTEAKKDPLPDTQLQEHETDKKVNSVTFSQEPGGEKPYEELTETKNSKDPKVSAWIYSSLYVPAPSTPCAATHVHPGNVVVPAVVEQTHELAVKALQSLKVVDSEVDPTAICTRREYARWLIASSLKLSRSPGHKIYPAMYIENITELAFDDVPVEDPDFPYIQGLAEAGLIASNLSGGDTGRDYGAVFQPDSYLSRQDLVSWKIALDRRELPGIDKETLQEVSGFIDIDRVHQDARPALMADLISEEHSIIASAFGFTRRFQPDKPTTIGQAAIALTSGEAADLVAEDLARLEAEALATQAVVADIAREVRAQRELDGNSQDDVNVEKAKREQAEKLIEELRVELEQVKAERDEEKYSYLKARATVDSERDILQILRQQVDNQSKELSALQAEVAGEKERFEQLRIEREVELEAASKLKTELEVEKRALELVRTWAEDEARQAREQGKILEDARRRWEGQGLEIDSDLDEALNQDTQTSPTKARLDSFVQQVAPRYNEPTADDVEFKTQVNDAISNLWRLLSAEEARAKLVSLIQRVAPRGAPTPEDVEFKSQVNDAIVYYWQTSTGHVTRLLHRLLELLEELGRKVRHVQENTMSSAGQRAEDVKAAVGERTQGMQGKMGESTQGFQGMVSERAEEVKAAVAGMSTNLVEGSKQASANLREEAQKFAQRFRN